MKTPKVALVHDYLVQYGGAEKTLEAMLEVFPDADVFTAFYKPEKFPESITSRNIIVPKAANKLYGMLPIISKYFTFMIPMMFESFELGEYDIVISDSASYAKGVLTKPDQLNISYIHTPPRFLYKYSVETTKRMAWYYAPVVRVVDHLLRLWDYNAAQRPDFLLCNSGEIKKRILKFYRRDATVIYPPVDLGEPKKLGDDRGDYYLVAGRLVAYKNFDLVIKAFSELPKMKLKVIGTGPEEKKLKALAKENVEFVGPINDSLKFDLMKNCLGLINAVKDEDFGIVPIEVLSHGNPVLAHKSAGHLETVIDGINGMYFEELNTEHLKQKIIEFDKEIQSGKYHQNEIAESAQRFSKREFQKKLVAYVEDKWLNKNKD